MRNGLLLTTLSVGVLTLASCDSLINTNTLKVTATAYTSHGNQTDSTPFTPACGGDLRDGVPTIAVSRDLFRAGLHCGTTVTINGNQYIVRDKMNKRYTQRIDIYHGTDLSAALEFGKRTVTIGWRA